MNFDILDKKMRVYEQSLDQFVSPDMFLIARLDGRSFSRLTKELCNFEAPFDIRFRDIMIQTVKELMDCGFRVVYGFTESDEISLLFHQEENAFGRKVRKYNSILSGIASAAFSLQLGQTATFDCRMIPLPDIEQVQDYFLWRQEDAHRNALNAHCYWLLRKEGLSAQAATAQLDGQSTAYKTELLSRRDILFDKLPHWQKRGIGIYWINIEKSGFNPITNTNVITTRRTFHTNMELPLGRDYALMISDFMK